jgi:hypothetical protein
MIKKQDLEHINLAEETYKQIVFPFATMELGDVIVFMNITTVFVRAVVVVD